MARRALILSGSIGKGHDSVALACESALSLDGVEARTLDCMRLLGHAGSAAGDAVFRRLLSIPAVYDGFHFGHLRTGTRLAMAMDRAATSRLVPRLGPELARDGGAALVLSVFPTGASAAGRMRLEGADMSAVALCTDACAHRMWVHDGTDLYLVCSELAEVTLRKYQPRAHAAVIPPPVRPEIYDAPTREVARGALGIPLRDSCVLVIAGGWGVGPLAESSRALARAGHHVLAVAGLNEKVRQSLEAVGLEERKVRPFGFTDRVPELMAAADVVVTSPGQTCNEARVVGRRLVLLDVVPGHGRENALHEIETGGASSCSPEPRSVVGVVESSLARPYDPPPWPVRSAVEWGERFVSTLHEGGVSLTA